MTYRNFTVLFILTLVLLAAGCQKDLYKGVPEQVTLRKKVADFVAAAGMDAAIQSRIDWNGIYERNRNRTTRVVVPLKESAATTVTNLVLVKDYWDDSLSHGEIIRVTTVNKKVATAAFHKFINFERGLENGTIEGFDLKFRPILKLTFKNGKEIRTEHRRPQRHSVADPVRGNPGAANGQGSHLADIGLPKPSCTDWYWVTYDRFSGEVYSAFYMYTECQNGVGDGTGIDHVDGIAGTSVTDYDPCAQALALKNNAEYKNKLNAMRAAYINQPYETVGLHTTSATVPWTFQSGLANQPHMSIDLTGMGNLYLKSVIHTHVGNSSQSLSIFSGKDMQTMYELMYNGYVADNQNFNMGLITSHGTTYTLQVEDYNAFMNFGRDHLTSTGSFTALEDAMINLGINTGGTPAQQLNGFQLMMMSYNMGITLMEGTPVTVNGQTEYNWKPIYKAPNGQLVNTPC